MSFHGMQIWKKLLGIWFSITLYDSNKKLCQTNQNDDATLCRLPKQRTKTERREKRKKKKREKYTLEFVLQSSSLHQYKLRLLQQALKYKTKTNQHNVGNKQNYNQKGWLVCGTKQKVAIIKSCAAKHQAHQVTSVNQMSKVNILQNNNY